MRWRRIKVFALHYSFPSHEKDVILLLSQEQQQVLEVGKCRRVFRKLSRRHRIMREVFRASTISEAFRNFYFSELGLDAFDRSVHRSVVA